MLLFQVVSGTKEHALYLWIRLSDSANAAKCARTAAKIQQLCDRVTPPDMRDESDEILAGVGFSPNFYRKVNNIRKINLRQIISQLNIFFYEPYFLGL